MDKKGKGKMSEAELDELENKKFEADVDRCEHGNDFLRLLRKQDLNDDQIIGVLMDYDKRTGSNLLVEYIEKSGFFAPGKKKKKNKKKNTQEVNISLNDEGTSAATALDSPSKGILEAIAIEQPKDANKAAAVDEETPKQANALDEGNLMDGVHQEVNISAMSQDKSGFFAPGKKKKKNKKKTQVHQEVNKKNNPSKKKHKEKNKEQTRASVASSNLAGGSNLESTIQQILDKKTGIPAQAEVSPPVARAPASSGQPAQTQQPAAVLVQSSKLRASAEPFTPSYPYPPPYASPHMFRSPYASPHNLPNRPSPTIGSYGFNPSPIRSPRPTTPPSTSEPNLDSSLPNEDEMLLAMTDLSPAVYRLSTFTREQTGFVDELLRKQRVKEAEEIEFQEFINLLKSAKKAPSHAKPPKSSWLADDRVRDNMGSLEAYAIDAWASTDQRKLAGMILKSMGLQKTAASALNLLIDVGYFPVHVNLELLKLNLPTHHSEAIIEAAEGLLSESSDIDAVRRIDLTHLKVYAIDVDEADELDDALSATRLEDGRIKIWIHVADPARYVTPGSKVDREARRRGTSVFLPTATYPMFPENLAMEGMSLRQGEIFNAVSVSVVLRSDGSIAEYSVDNSIIRPTYMLTNESASELLHLSLEEEVELKLLSEATFLRSQWRREQGAVDTTTLETRIKVVNPEDPEPLINLYVENQADPAMRLVFEMMILCGEVIATFGSQHNIPLPYRGQPQSNIDVSAFAHLPEGPVRSSSIVKVMRAAEMNFRCPVRHGVLGIPGYVQFTSPIRRYMDLTAHYQIKAFLRGGDNFPFSAGELEGIAASVNMQNKVVRKLCNSGLRYWVIEFLRRQQKGKKYTALILRFVKDRIASLLLVEVGFQATAWVSEGKQVGDEVEVRVVEAHPRDDLILLKEVI